MWVSVARTILKNRIAILVLLAVVTAFMGFQSQRIEMSYQYAPLLPEDDPAFLDNEYFAKVFGNEGEVVVLGVQDSLFFGVGHVDRWRQLKQELEAIHGVSEVFSVLDAYDLQRNTALRKFELQKIFPDRHAQSDLDSLRQVFERLPVYEGLLYNKKTKAYLMAVFLVPEVLQSPERVQLIENIKAAGARYEKGNGTPLHYSGLPFIRVETAEMVKRELNMFILLTLGITALVIFLFFRSFKVVLFSMLIVGIAVVWALGSQALLGFKVTILTGMIPPLIIVIGIPNSVFMLNKYHQEFRKHGNRIKSLQRMIRKIGNATFLTNLTTASGFATFIFTSSRLLVEFGIVAAINIMVVFVLSLLLIPIIYSFLGDPQERHTKHLDRKWMTGFVDQLLQVSLYHRKGVYLVSALLLLAGGYGISRMHTTGYMLDDVPHDHALYADLMFFEDHFGGLMPLEIVIDTQTPRGVMQTGNMQKMDVLQQRLDSFPEFSKPLSFLEVVKFSKQAYYNGHPNFYDVPNARERNFILSYLQGDGQASMGLVNTFMDSTRQKARISLRMADIGTTRMGELETKVNGFIEEVFPKEDYDTMVTGASIVFFKGTNYLIRNLFLSLSLAIVLIASFMAWMFSSKRMVIVSLLPNLLPLITTAALMGYFNIPIKPSTILVFSIAFGISVDDTIHFLAKYRQELSETNWNIRAAVILATKETGLSMVYTSIILFFGFGVFSMSEFGGTLALGLLVAFTLFVALFANLILLPSLLLTLERMITNQSFKEPVMGIYEEGDETDVEDDWPLKSGTESERQ
ncbi:efflux RND transporter permease subunit [Geofilum rubicundum]|nr:MMPL family transporter [Geofilum rubicundum]